MEVATRVGDGGGAATKRLSQVPTVVLIQWTREGRGWLLLAGQN